LSKTGFLVVITAPSGSGKTTIYKQLLKRNPQLQFSVSFTTRPRRQDEENGIDYYFVSKKEFMRKVERGDFVEWAEVHGEYYGTEKSQVDRCLKNGRICLLDVDVQGAINIQKNYRDLVNIFIMVPSLEELARRLKKRGTDSEERIKVRLRNAENELEYKKYFKYIVINDKVEEAVSQIEKIIESEKGKRAL